MFFHIDDNTTLPAEYVESLKKEYTGVYYDRFIRGDWVQPDIDVIEMRELRDRGYADIISRGTIRKNLVD